jgi:hypothetical protein
VPKNESRIPRIGEVDFFANYKSSVFNSFVFFGFSLNAKACILLAFKTQNKTSPQRTRFLRKTKFQKSAPDAARKIKIPDAFCRSELGTNCA